MCHCFIQLQSYIVLVHHSTTMFVQDIYMTIFCLMEALEIFLNFMFFDNVICRMFVSYDCVKELDNVCATN
jgi:hypothetical protein